MDQVLLVKIVFFHGVRRKVFGETHVWGDEV